MLINKELAAKPSDHVVHFFISFLMLHGVATQVVVELEMFDFKMFDFKRFGVDMRHRAASQVLVDLVLVDLVLVDLELVGARVREDLHLALVLFKALRKQHAAACARHMHANCFVYHVWLRHVYV